MGSSDIQTDNTEYKGTDRALQGRGHRYSNRLDAWACQHTWNETADILTKEATEGAENIEETEDILSLKDIRSGARESCMTKWQRQWEVTEKGRHLFKFRPKVDTKDKFTGQSKFPSIIRQLRTGYSKLNEYRH